MSWISTFAICFSLVIGNFFYTSPSFSNETAGIACDSSHPICGPYCDQHKDALEEKTEVCKKAFKFCGEHGLGQAILSWIFGTPNQCEELTDQCDEAKADVDLTAQMYNDCMYYWDDEDDGGDDDQGGQ